MTSEPLQPIADAITHEIVRLEAAYGLPLGVAVTIDPRAGTITAHGEGLRRSGPREELVATLTRNGLPHATLRSSATIVVYPSAA
ncbi:hypothetical protein KGQ19_01495 [Catenulispora sp. NL8]|uniref:Uncharacterized protein n=1 Tax=Catenulispora pinistramenti TaxID=2705254 RepID=A0ABS5KHS3_9ACTN|nr:hypothetical protein [Catenulispora pinistramenti]MBS2545535.1 hypothetical protein [Catenulispora pinistramenti]